MARKVIPLKGDGLAALSNLYLHLLNAALGETRASTSPQARANHRSEGEHPHDGGGTERFGFPERPRG